MLEQGSHPVLLFRDEAIETQRRRLHGEVTLHQPVSFKLLTIVLSGTVLAGLIFLATARYDRRETVPGWLTPVGGLAQATSPRGGAAAAVHVAVGDVVAAGAPLATLSLDSSGRDGGLAQQQRNQTQVRIAELDQQVADQSRHAVAETARLTARAAAVRAEAARLAQSADYQRRQLELARQQLERIGPLVAKGYVSGLERDRRAQAVLAQEQAVADLLRQAESRGADAADLTAQAGAAPFVTASELSQLRATKAALLQSLAEIDVQDGLVVRAPFAGRVAAVNLRPGETAVAGAPLFAIAPISANLRAELLVPGKAIGFIAAGQPVRLRIDAFPFQRFGVVRGVVTAVSRAPIVPGQALLPIEIKEPRYRVLVSLPAPFVKAYGRAQPLQPGMTLQSDIQIDRRTFLEWILDPLRAAQARAAA
jgi:membrane fusion protein